MAAIAQERTRTGILRAIRTLSVHHLNTVVKRLLEYDLPYDSHVIDTWHTLARDPSLASRIMDDLVEILNTRCAKPHWLWKEKAANTTRKVVKATFT